MDRHQHSYGFIGHLAPNAAVLPRVAYLARVFMKPLALLLVLPFLWTAQASTAVADEAVPAKWLNLTWENDWSTWDSGYSNGMFVHWGQGSYPDLGQAGLPGWLDAAAEWLPYTSYPGYSHDVSYSVSQLMYTPHGIEAKEVIEDDRPYAGVLLWSAYLHSWQDRFSNRYRLSLGAVGPISGAEQVQEFVHALLDVVEPRGWDNQLENEPVFLLASERLYRLHDGQSGGRWEYDVIGLSEIMAGTLRSEIGAGLGLRLGRNLAHSFCLASMIPGRNLHQLPNSAEGDWYVFANLYARYVFNDITLDGNYFRHSHSVSLTNEQGMYALGLVWRTPHWGVALSLQESSRTFEERKENTLFGSVSLVVPL